MKNQGSRLRTRLLLLALALIPLSAEATLYGIAYDRNTSSESLVRVSTVDASITNNAQVSLFSCCRVNGNLVAADQVSQTVYFVTPDSAAWRMHRISLTSGAAISVSLPPAERVAAILRRESTSTLYALSDAGAGLRLTTISNAGAVVDVGAPILVDCCAIRVGVAALSADATRIAFVGRLKSIANDASLRLFVINTATGVMISDAMLMHAPDLLYSRSGTEFSAIYHDASTQTSYVGIIADDGSIKSIGAGLANCCAMLTGIGALQGNLIRVVARTLDTTDLALYVVDRTMGTFQNIGTLPPRYVIQGLIESNAVLASDLIFANGFEIATAIADLDSDKRSIDDAWQGATVADTAGSDSTQAAPGDARVDAQFESDPKGNPLPQDAVALPLGSVALWALLSLLMGLIAARFQRRPD